MTAALSVAITLDALFRANAAARPDTLALADAPERAAWTDGAARRINYAEADAKIDRLARRFRSLGLPDGAIVALQMPNIVEGVLALLAILRVGLVAAPVPMLWRRAELVQALGRVDARALVTVTRHGADAPAQVACEAAMELFHLSFPCAFGAAVPDGVIPLDLDGTADDDAGLPPAADSAAVAIATFDAAPDGFFALHRNHAHWLAAGLATFMEAKIAPGDGIVTALAPVSLPGIAGALVPWLLSGGTLQLALGAARMDAVQGGTRVHLVAPASLLKEIAAGGGARPASVIAVHRAPEAFASAPAAPRDFPVVDLVCFGELGCVAMRRGDSGKVSAIPLGPITAPAGAPDAPMVVETRIEPDGILSLSGPMVPAHRSAAGGDGFARTGYRARADGAGGLTLEANMENVAAIGGLRFGLDDLAARVGASVPGARIATIADPLLGTRLLIETEDAQAAAAALEAAGHCRLVVEAVTSAGTKRRAAG